MLDFQKLSADYQQALLRQVVPFWLKNSRDALCGGYFDLLTATGDVIDGDKSVTAQAQQAGAFAWLYNTFDGQPAWMAHARHGSNFLRQFAHTATFDCYAQLDRRGRPLRLAADTIPASTAVMAYAQLHRATGEEDWAILARQVFANLLKQRDTTRDQQREIGGFQQIRHLSEATQLLKAVLDMQPLLDEEAWKAAVDIALQEIMVEFLDRRSNVLREYILPEGGFINTPEGRRINVGLTFQTIGYLLDLCAQNGDRKMTMQAVTWCLQMCEQAWEEATGGLNRYVDLKGQVSIFPDAQQKWAWVHAEATACLIKGYFQTRHPDCPKWFKRIHEYTFQHFPDSRQNGWHLAVDSQRVPVFPAKSIPEAGCFPLIRCLAETAKTLVKCSQLQPLDRTIRVN